MIDACNNLRSALIAESEYLIQIGKILDILPDLLSRPEICSSEYFAFLESCEIRARELRQQKEEALVEIAAALQIPVAAVTFGRLERLGYSELAVLGAQLFRLASNISYAVLKNTIFLKHFATLNNSFMRLLGIFTAQGYGPSGQHASQPPKVSIVREA